MTNNELRKNVTSAMKSFELEGFVYTEEEKRIFNKIANGELSLKELGDEIDKTLPKK